MNLGTNKKQGLRIGIMGATPDIGNRGVTALAVSLIGLLRRGNSNSEIFLMLGGEYKEPYCARISGEIVRVPIWGYRLTPRKFGRDNIIYIIILSLIYKLIPLKWVRSQIIKGNSWIKNVLEADLIGDVRGGDSFSDIYGTYNFLAASLPALSVIILRGNITLFPQTYGPFKSPIARRIAAFIVMHSSTALSRDKDSLDVIQQLTGGKKTGIYCPDVAFTLEARAPNELVNPAATYAAERRPVLGININGLMYNGGYTRQNMFGLQLDYKAYLVRLITELVTNEKATIHLIPHTFSVDGDVESDPHACQLTYNSLPESIKAHIIVHERWLDQHELKFLIGRCEAFIGSRMHSCIAALSQAIPAIGVAYSKKFVGVFESVDASDWIIDGRYDSTDEAVKKSIMLIQRRTEMQKRLKETAPRAIDYVHFRFKELLNTINYDTSAER